MSAVKTHTGIVVTRDGEQRKKLHATRDSWVVGKHEFYDKRNGFRWGAPGMSRRLLLDTIRPIKGEVKL